MRQRLFITTALIGIFGLFIYLSCCDDCPTCPADPVAGSYYVYITDTNYLDRSYIWIIDSGPDSVIDSIVLPPFVKEIDVSPDGNYLAAGMPGDSMLIFNLENNEVISSIVSGEHIDDLQPYFTNNNTELVISACFRSIPISKYDIFTGQLIATDTFELELMGKTYNSPYVYGYKAYDDSLEYHIYDYSAMSLVKKFVVHRADGSLPYVHRMLITPDEEYACFTGSPDKVFRYNLLTDSLCDSVNTLYNAYQGYMDFTTDGSYLLVTERGEMLYMPEVGTLLIVDMDGFTTLRRVCSYGYNPANPTWPANPGKVAILPDGSRAYVVSNNSIGAYLPATFDLLDFSATVPGNLPYSCSGQAVAIGKEIRKE